MMISSVWIGFLLVVASFHAASLVGPECPSFEAEDFLFEEESLECSKECMNWERGNAEVYGTTLYHKDSDPCLAALHAGVLDLNGGSLTYKKITYPNGKYFSGTCKNRICSKNKSIKRPVYFEDPQKVSNKKVTEVFLVHNSYYKKKLGVVCLFNDLSIAFNKSYIRSWDYSNKFDKRFRVDLDQTKVIFELESWYVNYVNYHGLRCLGNQVSSDVDGPLIFQDAKYKSIQYTWRANQGEDLTIEIIKNSKEKVDYDIRRHPGSILLSQERIAPGEAGNERYSFLLKNISQEDDGLYQLGDYKSGAYFNIVVRECPSGKYGNQCNEDCKKCQNGGNCHSFTGECLCPPGFVGEQCDHACPKGWFGTKCQFQCNQRVLSLLVPMENSCQGLTICLPRPMGCSCPAGYKGPLCNESCSDNRFGAGCIGDCKNCGSKGCDPYTGSCLSDDDELVPKPPTNLRVSALDQSDGTIKLTWDDDDYNSNIRYFIITKATRSCNTNVSNISVLQMVEDKEAPLPSIKSDTDYEICLHKSVAGKGHSKPTCISYTTAVQEPSMQYTESCSLNGMGIYCTLDVRDKCLDFYVMNFTFIFRLSSYLACNNTTIEKEANLTWQDSRTYNGGGYVYHYFRNVIPGIEHSISIKVLYKNIELKEFHKTLTSKSEQPPPVENLTVAILGEDTIRYMWRDPCPSNGEFQKYFVRWGQYDYKTIYKTNTTCPKNINFDGCYTRGPVNIGCSNKYHCNMQIINADKKYGTKAPYTFKMTETEPSAPSGITTELKGNTSDIWITIDPPVHPGGEKKNCSVILDKSCTVNYIEDKDMICKFSDKEPGKIYDVEAYCCNTKYCGDKLKQKMATKPKLELESLPKVKQITNSTITVSLPRIRSPNENSSIYISVEHVTEGKKQILKTDEGKMLIKEIIKKKLINNQTYRKKRDVSSDQSSCEDDVWIAGQVSGKTEEFVVGDGTNKNGFYNCPLGDQEKYNLGFLTVTYVLDKNDSLWNVIFSDSITADPQLGTTIAIIVIIIIIIVVVALILIKNRDKLQKIRALNMMGSGSETATTQDQLTPDPERHAPPLLQPSVRMSSVAKDSGMGAHKNDSACRNAEVEPIPTSSRLAPLPAKPGLAPIPAKPRLAPIPAISESEPIYSNSEMCTNNYSRVPQHELDSYFNMLINSSKAIEDFSSVPTHYKSMDTGALPEHKKKNRYRNNLPYDETRVILGITDDDPTTDYINANHIEGYGNTQYIATQGPKDDSTSTMKDFWRMIIEQKVSAIIMVANFTEGGKKKVGQYMPTTEGTMHFDKYTIKVTSMEHLPYFTVSNIQVSEDGVFQQNITHYHYTNWPDHGIPQEARTMASLITTFLENHTEGGVIVHCSAGIGRTGTVLMVLLLLEMLELEGSVDPVEVLVRLRKGRGRLVENSDQYNLALKITDEILFGSTTSIVASETLKDCLSSLLTRAKAEYMKAKSLISPLTYKTTSNPLFSHLNRNQEILPSDRYRLYLSMVTGMEESQYINAIHINRWNDKESLLATEHPVHKAAGKFWRLIVENRCGLVIFINRYSAYKKDEFIPLYPEDVGEIKVDQYNVTNTFTQRCGPNLKQCTLTVKDPKDLSHSLTAYQVLNWEYGRNIPESPEVLLGLADILLQQTPASQGCGPPLLCCGDGVTGCGLVAGVMLLIEQAQTEQLFDIYRTVVKLLRCRYQFITDEEQYSMLYTAASKYIDSFATYGNFN